MEPCNSPTIKTSKLTIVLIYAVLEWTLIFFLLLNSLFFHLIIKFARYFRLKPPCLICSSLDHILNPQNSCTNLICEHHSIALSKSRYCFAHRKLAESQELCADCSLSHPDLGSQVEQLKCSCCLGVLGDAQKGNFVGNSDQDEGGVVLEAKGGLHLDGANSSGGAIRGAYENEVVLPQHLDFYIDHDDYGLIPVEFFNSDQEKGGQVWRETDDELVFEPDGVAGEQNLSPFCLDFMKLEEPKIQALPNKQEVDGIVRLDEPKIESLPTVTAIDADVAADELVFVPDGIVVEQNLSPFGLNVKKLDEPKIQDLPNKQDVDGIVRLDETKIESLSTVRALDADVAADELVCEPDGIISEPNLSSYYLDVMKLDEPKIQDLPNKQEVNGIVRLDETKFESLPTIKALDADVAADELVFELDGIVGEPSLSSDCLDVMKLDEPKIQDLPNKQDVDGIVRIDEIKIESLPTIKDLDADVAADGSKVEKFPTTQGQAEETKREVNLEVADDQSSEVWDFDAVQAKIPTRDSEDVCGNESNEIGIKNGDVHVEEGPSTSVIREASTDTSYILESDHCDSWKEEGPPTTIEIHEASTEEAKTEEEGEDGNENELNVVVEDGIPDTPTSIDSLQVLHRKLLLLGRSKIANDESLDGECGDEGTMEELKSELRAERKTLCALYEELEEERSAAAIAASHTMAMINRLQEEKAMIEMEALQYQRMMEEQAEYDQEALQLMNEILAKREREKEELERELEASRKKLMDYEEREEISNGNYTTTSSAFSSNNESKENGHHDSSTDAILSLKDSLSSFEDERLSILEQLKLLEDNLCTLAEEEDHQIRNMKTFGDANGSDSEFSEEDEGRLDPFLLDELPLTRFESEKRRFTIEEEVERLYERLQALEADKEFIRHCFGTLRKGDRGIYLLQEILQHLRDLKSLELRARSFDGVC